MSPVERFYSLLADLVLVVHFSYVAFVVVGFVIIWLGFFLRWQWVRNFYFRLAHLVAMGIVALEAVAGIICPLTVWEERLRFLAGGGHRYAGSFVQHWLHRILFYEASESVFQVLYVAFFTLILLSLWVVKPRWPRRRS